MHRTCFFSRFVTLLLGLFIYTGVSAADCKVNDPDIAKTYSGSCVNGLAHGKGVATGRDEYTGLFVKGNKHGKGTYTWPDGNRYEGDWKDDKQHGKGTYSWANGSRYTGEYKADKRNGYGEMRIVKGDSGISSYGSKGRWDGNTYVARGWWENNSFLYPCNSHAHCQQVGKQRSDSERRAANAKHERIKNCQHVYVGRIFVDAPGIFGRTWEVTGVGRNKATLKGVHTPGHKEVYCSDIPE